MQVSNWGNYPVTEAEVKSFSQASEILPDTADWDHYISRGLGRCYGDSALSPHILSTLKFNRFLEFDKERGTITCQSGVSFEEVLDVIVPEGWFLPVTPGTKFVTVGGAIAADVHGKNHHSEGSFGAHVRWLRLLTPAGLVLTCSREENPEVFAATCGGMGLTGIILDVQFNLKKIETVWIKEESIKTKNLEELFPMFERSMEFTYSVAWIDCLAKGKHLGKGILLNGEHATLADLKTEKQKRAPLTLPKKKKLSLPPVFPSFTINPLTTKAFNILWYAKAPKGTHVGLKDYDAYFYPLDGLHHWNRVYGNRGFAQYQFVIPPKGAFDGLVKILEKIAKHKLPSFLTVLKYFGPQDGMLSFPMEGYTLALDFPRTKKLFTILDELDEIVLGLGGRIYLTKDCRMSPEMFKKGYPHLDQFLEIKSKLDSSYRLSSLQSERLEIRK